MYINTFETSESNLKFPPNEKEPFLGPGVEALLSVLSIGQTFSWLETIRGASFALAKLLPTPPLNES